MYLNRKEKRDLIKKNSHIASPCPKCGRKSLYSTDGDYYARCILCGQIVSDRKFTKHGFVKL